MESFANGIALLKKSVPGIPRWGQTVLTVITRQEFGFPKGLSDPKGDDLQMDIAATRHYRIRGQVQGVGFRYSTKQEAQRLGLSGWVRNCPDYSVKVTATGKIDLLDAFEQWLHHGPPGARVQQVESSIPEDADAQELALHSSGFEILR